MCFGAYNFFAVYQHCGCVSVWYLPLCHAPKATEAGRGALAKGAGGCPAPWLAAALCLAGQSCWGGENSSCCQSFTRSLGTEHKLWRTKRHLKLLSCLSRPKCHREPRSCCSPAEGEETVPSLCLLLPWAKPAWPALYPLQTGEESALLPLPVFSFILLLHQLAASDGQVSLVPGPGSSPAPPGRSACCWQCVGRRVLLQVRASSWYICLK